MRVAIIGAGWYGCHIGKSLLKRGIDVTLFEKNADIFSGASRYNTGRLHLGFHYPRSDKTRKQSKEGFALFTAEYGHCCELPSKNLYLVANQSSLMDFQTYCSILDSENLNYEIINPSEYGFINIEGGLICSEKAINPIKAANHFRKVLKGHLSLNTEVTQLKTTDNGILVNGQLYDYCINCTYYTYDPGTLFNDICYENVVTVLFKPTKRYVEKSFVIMDGNFYSVNPYYSEKYPHIYSLYHVNHSVISSNLEFSEAIKVHNKTTLLPINEQLAWQKLKDDVVKYYPTFYEELEPIGSFLSIRTKLINENANRECIIEKENALINVLSGKINSIFEVEERVLNILKEG